MFHCSKKREKTEAKEASQVLTKGLLIHYTVQFKA